MGVMLTNCTNSAKIEPLNNALSFAMETDIGFLTIAEPGQKSLERTKKIHDNSIIAIKKFVNVFREPYLLTSSFDMTIKLVKPDGLEVLQTIQLAFIVSTILVHGNTNLYFAGEDQLYRASLEREEPENALISFA